MQPPQGLCLPFTIVVINSIQRGKNLGGDRHISFKEI